MRKVLFTLGIIEMLNVLYRRYQGDTLACLRVLFIKEVLLSRISFTNNTKIVLVNRIKINHFNQF